MSGERVDGPRARELGLCDRLVEQEVRVAVERERSEQERLMATEDFREGVAAMAERRTPKFNGR